jgi:hypothetical protein
MERYGGSVTTRGWERFRKDSYLEPAADADRRFLPKDPKQTWGFDANDLLSNLSQGQQGKVRWKQTFANLQKTGLTTEGFYKFLTVNHVEASEALQQLLASQEPQSAHLNAKYRIGYPPEEFEKALSLYGFSEDQVDDLLQAAIPGSRETTIAELTNTVRGNRHWVSLAVSTRQKIVKNVLLTKAPLLHECTAWYDLAAPRATRRRPERLIESTTGRVTSKICTLATASQLHAHQQDLLKQDEKYRLSVVGRRTEVQTVFVTRTIKPQPTDKAKTILVAKRLCGRFVPLSLAAAELIQSLQAKDVLRQPSARMPIVFWIDGSSLMKTSTVLVRWRFMYRPGLLTKESEENRKRLCKVQTWISIPMAEKYQQFALILKPILIEEKRSLQEELPNCFLALFLADNKCSQVCHGLNNGKFPCALCYWARSDRVYRSGLIAPARSLATVISRLEDTNSSTARMPYGDKNIPILYDEQSKSSIPDVIYPAIDTLHVIENTGKDLWTFVLKDCRELFHRNNLIDITTKFNGGAILIDYSSDTMLRSGSVRVLRELYASLDSTIKLDKCWNDQLDPSQIALKGRCLDLLTTFSNIICILYSPIECRCRGLTLSLYVLLFVLFKQMEELAVPFRLPAHQAVYHLPEQSRLFCLSELSTEDFEALWKHLRQRASRHSNASDDPMMDLHRHIYFKEALKTAGLRAKSFEVTVRMEERACMEFLQAPFLVPPRFAVGDDFNFFLYSIRDYHEGVWYSWVSDRESYQFNFACDSNVPVMLWYSGESVDLQQLIDTAAESNPANARWRIYQPSTLVDDPLSAEMVFDVHPRGDIDNARKARLRSLGYDDDTRLEWLKMQPKKKKPLLQIMNFDNHVIKERAKHGLDATIPNDYGYDDPLPDFALGAPNLDDFISSSPEMSENESESRGEAGRPARTATTSSTRKRKRPAEDDDDPSTWGIKRLRSACKAVHINIRHQATEHSKTTFIPKSQLATLYANHVQNKE